MKKIFALFILFVTGCVSTPVQFEKFAAENPDGIWSEQASKDYHQLLDDYRSKKKLPSGLTYGESVRFFSLKNKCASEIDKQLSQKGCLKEIDVIKAPDTQKPILTSDSKTIPLVIYICPDGGIVRLKPQGDVTSKLRPQPNSTKALRFPYNSKFDSFDDEKVKIDNAGNPIPKWKKDMNPALTQSPKWLQSWADDAHTDLSPVCGKADPPTE